MRLTAKAALIAGSNAETKTLKGAEAPFGCPRD